MALTAFAGVLSYVFWSKKVPQNSVAQKQAVEDPASTSSSPETINPAPSEPQPISNSLPLVAGVLRPDQPPKLKPQSPSRSPDWKLLDWSVKPLPEKPGIELRAACYSAPGKYTFVRVEQEIQIGKNGEVQVLKSEEMVGDQIIVKLPNGALAKEIQSFASKFAGNAADKPFAPNTWLISLPRKLEAVPEVIAGSASTGIAIDYIEPNYLVRSLRTPNDPRFINFNQWHLYNNTQINNDIKAPKAWDRRTTANHGTTNKVIVAVIDCGVRYTHEDLMPNMWMNPAEIANNSDDDGNGIVDDIYGADFFSNDGDPMTADSHGTQCAGLIAAAGNNGLGITGVAWDGAQIMALRFINGNSGSITDAIKCIDYAVNKGAKVINASYGGMYSPSRTEMEAIQRAETAGVIMVAAAGNGTDEPYTDQNGNSQYDNGEPFTDWNNNGIWDKWYDNDSKPFYPASYSSYTFPRSGFNPPVTITLNNIISVGATDRTDSRAYFSNYGTNSVDLMAPGVEMWSTTVSGTSNITYTNGQGTSFAAPVVSGAVALLRAEYPTNSVTQIVNLLVSSNSVDSLTNLVTYCKTGGRLNLSKLLPAADTNSLPLANVSHRPEVFDAAINTTMRTPTNAVYSNAVALQSALKRFNNTNGFNTYGLVASTGGTLFYRTGTNGSWLSNRLSLSVTNGDYQYLSGTISNVPVGSLQYYLQFNFDSGARTTYSYYTNNPDGFATTTNPVTAQSSPYTFTVSKANATISITGTNQTYNGSARTVTISTTPSNLVTATTYNSNSSAPTNAGSYAVIATVNDSNYQGSASNVLTVAKALASLVIGNTNQTYNGLARSVSVTTTPTNLASTVTYNGLALAPADPGLYAVSAAINEMNYEGSASASLTIGGISNPTGDTNNNGQPDLLEYAITDSSAITTNGPTAGFVTTQSSGGNSNNVITMTALVRTNDPKLTYTPKASVDLSSTNWLTNGFTTNTSNQANVPAGFQRREYQFNAGTNPRAFLKLTIEQK